jgi:hypothetical protein
VNQRRTVAPGGPNPELRENPPLSTATDATLIALGERFEKLLLEHMDAWLIWAPRMRAARAEVEDNTASCRAGNVPRRPQSESPRGPVGGISDPRLP